ncbi:DUF5624 domain-containing protein [Amycolatopsis sp.]|jgi:hypothetical protein|uniref:DUF5624 domain-containing protein n=1 Tax=Amycolatopsis sp. TaxID=37632 RepID=UPI002DF8888B|nr:DUF5624 domain-containing protein [Amycolatopsis sp.]
MNTAALDGSAVQHRESPELVDLFHAYTAGHDTIGARLTAARADRGHADPLIVATGRDIALFAGNGAAPEVESFRMGNRGFKELAGVSHLGPAIASLVLTKELRGDDSWRTDAERLLGKVQVARAANDAEVWRDEIAVDAFRGMEKSIADMVDYSCAVTARYLRRALADDSYLNSTTLRTDYLAGDGSADLPVPVNHMMVATFFLAGMDAAHRVMRWFDRHPIDWHEAMVLVAGRQGRPTAGVTWNTSSVATIIVGASRKRLPLERLYMAPHAPVFDTPAEGDLSGVAAIEPAMRELWFFIRVTVELGRTMFPGYPAFQPNSFEAPDLTARQHAVISEMPVIHSPTDFDAMITRMRMVLEDPRQLLSGAVTDFAVDQLIMHDNDPTKVIVPGLTGVDYPTGLR